MKRYTLMEHLEDFFKWESRHGRVFSEQTSWFTAYERWLNDRPLLTEEDNKEKPAE